MTVTTAAGTAADRVPRWMPFLLATACGLIAANLYIAQPLAGPISAALGLSPQATGLIVTLTQIGFGAGLLLIVPLRDLVENRRLIVVTMGVAALALLGAALSPHAFAFLVAALFIGFGSVGVHVLIPYTAHIAPEAARGRIVGNVMSGLMLGVMLARPVSSFIADRLSWQAVFFVSAGAMVVFALILSQAVPRHVPTSKLRYGQLLVSLGRLAATTPVLQRRAFYHGVLGAAFSLFWTTTPLVLAGPQFHLTQNGIGLFALAGVSGVAAAPLGGRLADCGWGRLTTAIAMLVVVAAFLLTQVAAAGSITALALLVAAAILVDLGVTANMSVGQRIIFSLAPEIRGRLNGLYTASFFAGGAVGSALGGWASAHGGWPLTAGVGIALPIVALMAFATE